MIYLLQFYQQHPPEPNHNKIVIYCWTRCSFILDSYLRCLNAVFVRFTGSVSDAGQRAPGLWYANKAIPQFCNKMDHKVRFCCLNNLVSRLWTLFHLSPNKKSEFTKSLVFLHAFHLCHACAFDQTFVTVCLCGNELRNRSLEFREIWLESSSPKA